MTDVRYRVLECPVRPLVLSLGPDDELSAEWVSTSRAEALGPAAGDSALLDDLAARLRAYFAGEPADFSDVPLPRGTAFQRRCWRACRAIPRGRTRSYAQLAMAAGSPPGAARAAGQAMRCNPLPIFIPCHRVIAADGRLHGFAGETDPEGQSLDLKARLLELERSFTGMPA